MKEIKLSNAIKIKVFNSDDYTKNNKQINDYLNAIIKEYNSAIASDYIDNLNGDIFLQNKKVFIYVLFNLSQPISFALFSKTSNTCVSLDLMYTAYDYTKLGFATILVRVSAINLKENNIQKFFCKTDENNLILQNLLNSFARVEMVKFSKADNQCSFDIQNINGNDILDKIKQFIIK